MKKRKREKKEGKIGMEREERGGDRGGEREGERGLVLGSGLKLRVGFVFEL